MKDNQSTDDEPKVVAKEGCFLQTMNAGCIVTVVFIVLIFLIALLGSG